MSLSTSFCLRPGRFLLPGNETDMTRWPVVACDQYTSQPEYWEKAAQLVGTSPSTLSLILPECYLSDSAARVPKIHENMRRYLREGIFSRQVNGLVLIRRTIRTGSKWGLLVCVDLEQYDYAADSASAVRPTEGTIAARIPPRLAVRREAPLELSHILLLADDPGKTLIEPLAAQASALPLLYDTDLMEGGGHITGWAVEEPALVNAFLTAAQALAETSGGLQFAVGDGNHSLATARAHWLEIRDTLSDEEKEHHPARFAMAELNNLHDDALVFEPIHRAIFDVPASRVREWLAPCGPVLDLEHPDLILVHEKGDLPLRITHPLHELAVGTVQLLLDRQKDIRLDYIHGEEAVRELVKEQQAVGILLSPIKKESLFPAVRLNGPLPRKAFSMGEAPEKRYYLEARKIVL